MGPLSTFTHENVLVLAKKKNEYRTHSVLQATAAAADFRV